MIPQLFPRTTIPECPPDDAISAPDRPAILAGVLTDLNGNLRIANGVVDTGAYEFQLPSSPGLCKSAAKGDFSCDGIAYMVDLATVSANRLDGVEGNDECG